jgi:hypothetical protein
LLTFPIPIPVVRKGRTVRGQWFYATDYAAKNYVWFHSVHDLVRRSIEAKGVDVVDLGPSGSDAFSELKERYGFLSVDEWVSYSSHIAHAFRFSQKHASHVDVNVFCSQPAVADYQGPFWYNTTGTPKKGISGLAAFLEKKWGLD